MKKLFLVFLFFASFVAVYSQQVDLALLPFISDNVDYQVVVFGDAVKTRKALKTMKTLGIRPASPQELKNYYKEGGNENVFFVSPVAIYLKENWIGVVKTVPVIFQDVMYLDYFRGSKWPPRTIFVGVKI